MQEFLVIVIYTNLTIDVFRCSAVIAEEAEQRSIPFHNKDLFVMHIFAIEPSAIKPLNGE